MDYSEGLAGYIEREKAALGALDLSAVSDAMNLVLETARTGGTVYTCGNGGSAATASHFACDFNKGVYAEAGVRLRFECLCDNAATCMAVANDIGYDEVFAYQLRGRVRPQDVLLAISGSGNSENVVRAAEYARSQGCRVVGLTGYSGGRLKALSDVSLHVAVDDMQIAEDVHMAFDHMMMRTLCDSEKGGGAR